MHFNKCSILVMLLVFIGFVSGLVDAGEFAGGTGTVEDPYLVETAANLNNVRNHMDMHFKQIDDIDLGAYSTENGWQPIGVFIGFNHKDNQLFLGSFNGNGYTISNMRIHRPDENGIGLFAYVGEKGELKDVNLKGIEVIGGDYVGGLVGRNEGGAIFDSSVKGEIKGNRYVGGLVGHNHLLGGNIIRSRVEGIVIGNGNVGGLVGSNSTRAIISNSYAKGSVFGNAHTGGLVGVNFDEGKIGDSFFKGEVVHNELKRYVYRLC